MRECMYMQRMQSKIHINFTYYAKAFNWVDLFCGIL